MVLKILINLWYTLKCFGLPNNKYNAVASGKKKYNLIVLPKKNCRNHVKSKCTALTFVANICFDKLISIHDWKHRIEDRCNPKISRNLGYTKSTALSCILNIFGLIRLIEFMSTRRRNNANIIKDQVSITAYGYG